MKRGVSVAVMGGALCVLATSPLGAQMARETTLHWSVVGGAYDSVARSIVRLRTVAQVERPVTDRNSRLPSRVTFPMTSDGIGIVVDIVYEAGRREYVILTNYHVANLNPFLEELTSQLKQKRVEAPPMSVLEERTYVIHGAGDEPGERIRTVLVSRDLRGDMALLRTVGADRDLVVFPYDIGLPDAELQPRTPVVAGGFRAGEKGLVSWGTVTGIRHHTLGLPHTDYTVSIPVEHGESGNPVFVIRGEDGVPGPDLRFVLVGLLHAQEEGVSYMVPFSAWQGALCETPTGRRRSSHCPSQVASSPGSADGASPGTAQ